MLQLGGQAHGALGVLAQQALDTYRHVVQAAGGVDARPHCEAEVGSDDSGRPPGRHLQQGLDTGTGLAGADALQARRHQNAIVVIQGHHIGHRTQCHQVGILRQVGLIALLKPAAPAQFCPQREHHVEDHADTRQVFAGKIAARLVGVDDDIGGGQLATRQVVIGDQGGDAQRPGRGHPLDTGNTIVHGNDQVGPPGGSQLDDLGGQAVTVLETVGDQVIDLGSPERPQAGYRQG